MFQYIFYRTQAGAHRLVNRPLGTGVESDTRPETWGLTREDTILFVFTSTSVREPHVQGMLTHG